MKNSLFLILFVSLFFISACSNGKTQSLEMFYKDANIENVNKVIIQDGSTGYSKTITDQEQIEEFLTLIKDIEFTPQENQEKRYGWRYNITLFDDEKEFSFSLDNIHDTYYNSEPDIQPIVDDYYKKLDSQ